MPKAVWKMPVTKPASIPAMTAAMQRHRHGTAVQRQNNAHGAAGAERAVHGQVGHVEDLIGDVNANGHYTPDKTLSGRARHGTEQGRQKLHG